MMALSAAEAATWAQVEGNLHGLERQTKSQALACLTGGMINQRLQQPLQHTVEEVFSNETDRSLRHLRAALRSTEKALWLDAKDGNGGHCAKRWLEQIRHAIKAAESSYKAAVLEKITLAQAVQMAQRWADLSPAKDADSSSGRCQVLLQQVQKLVGAELLAVLLSKA
jgi:hypothetical protein